MTETAQPKTSEPRYTKDGIELHDREAFKSMHKAGKLAAETLDYITDFVKPDVTTEELDKLCYDFITEPLKLFTIIVKRLYIDMVMGPLKFLFF